MASGLPTYFSIQQFFGIQQQADGSLLPIGTARDARNISTYDGDLKVANGYKSYDEVNGTTFGKIVTSELPLKLIPVRGHTHYFVLVTTGGIYATNGGGWQKTLSFETAISNDAQVDYTQMLINTDEYVIVATGQTRMYKIAVANILTTPVEFGSGLYSYEGVVDSYDSVTKTVTLTTALSSEAARHALIDGITFDDYENCEVVTASGTTVELFDDPATTPTSGMRATVRGGGSNVNTNFVTKYGGRLFAAGDPAAPCRLYWSQVVGDGRTIEDWLSLDASADAAGGYVEIGDERGDKIVGICSLPNQILIFKQYSVWRMSGDRPSTFNVDCVEKDSENMSNASVVVKYGQPYWLTRSGLQSYSSDAGVGAADGGNRYLREFFLTDGYSAMNSRGCHADNRMYFTCKESDVASDNCIIEYDLGTGSIMLRDGFFVYDLCVLDGHIYIITRDYDIHLDGDTGYFVAEFNIGDSYCGIPINAYWETQPTDMGAKFIVKQIKEIHARCGDGNMNIYVRSDSREWLTQRMTFDDIESGYIDVPVRTDQGRVFQIRFENVQGSQMWLKGGIHVEYERTVKR